MPRAWRAMSGTARWPDHATFPVLLLLGSFLVDLLCYNRPSERFRDEMRVTWQTYLRKCIDSVHSPHEMVRTPFVLAEAVLRALNRIGSNRDNRFWRPGPLALIMVAMMSLKKPARPCPDTDGKFQGHDEQ
ncbi:MAG: hypothetical protein ACYCXG_11465 [Acidiferrobacter sp.]